MHDSIIFDIDGVLIDITKSYDLTTDMTCRHVLASLQVEPVSITGDVIDGFKETGGFNDEIDLTYACILSIYAARQTGADPYDIMRDAAHHADQTGIDSTMRYIGSICDVSGIISRLGPPGDRNGAVQRTFDQIFYGPQLYREIFGEPCQFDAAMIDGDNILVTKSTLDAISARFGKKIAIVSGRGYRSASYSLGGLVEYFDVPSSAFLEDMPRHLAKPNPKPLVDAIASMGSSGCIYVGDSMEDCMMARDARAQGYDVGFFGIVGASKNPQNRRRMFEGMGVDTILDSVHEIPKILND